MFQFFGIYHQVGVISLGAMSRHQKYKLSSHDTEKWEALRSYMFPIKKAIDTNPSFVVTINDFELFDLSEARRFSSTLSQVQLRVLPEKIVFFYENSTRTIFHFQNIIFSLKFHNEIFFRGWTVGHNKPYTVFVKVIMISTTMSTPKI